MDPTLLKYNWGGLVPPDRVSEGNFKFFILSYSGGVLTSTDIRTYQSLRFIPEYVDVIMALEVAINFINMNVG